MTQRTVRLRADGTVREATIDGAHVQVGGDDFIVEVLGPGALRLTSDLPRFAWGAASGDARWVFVDGCAYELEIDRGGRPRGAGRHHGSLSAPMPATVVSVAVAVGEHVVRGHTLLVLEAMKMELPVKATADGTVTAIHCREGQLVQPGIALIDLD